MKRHQREARKRAISEFCLDENTSYLDVAKRLFEEPRQIIEFDTSSKEKCAQYIYLYMSGH